MPADILNRLLAGAINAAVRTAGPATFGQSFSKMFASPVQSHGEIVTSHAQCRRNVLRSLALQINFFQQLPILLGHKGQKTLEAFAKFTFFLFVWTFRQLLFESIQRPLAGSLFPININDRPPENPIEPLCCFLVRVGMPIRRQCFNKAFLHDIFGQMVIAKTFSSKGYENLEIHED